MNIFPNFYTYGQFLKGSFIQYSFIYHKYHQWCGPMNTGRVSFFFSFLFVFLVRRDTWALSNFESYNFKTNEKLKWLIFNSTTATDHESEWESLTFKKGEKGTSKRWWGTGIMWRIRWDLSKKERIIWWRLGSFFCLCLIISHFEMPPQKKKRKKKSWSKKFQKHREVFKNLMLWKQISCFCPYLWPKLSCTCVFFFFLLFCFCLLGVNGWDNYMVRGFCSLNEVVRNFDNQDFYLLYTIL